jgi:hypothetical protein
VADSDLTLPATVALELGVEASDPRLPRLIAAASRAIRSALNRQLHYGASISEKTRGYGRPRICLQVTPVITVASVTLLDGTVLTPSEYSIESADAGLLYRSGGFPSTGAFRGGLPPQTDLASGSEAPTITVVYAGGWVTPAQATSSGWAGPVRSLPEDLEEACIQLCTNLYRGGGQAANVSAESLGDYSVTYADRARVGVLTPAIQELIAPYLRPEG